MDHFAFDHLHCYMSRNILEAVHPKACSLCQRESFSFQCFDLARHVSLPEYVNSIVLLETDGKGSDT